MLSLRARDLVITLARPPPIVFIKKSKKYNYIFKRHGGDDGGKKIVRTVMPGARSVVSTTRNII